MAPGRALKFFLPVQALVVWGVWGSPASVLFAASVGGALGVLPLDLRERGMLGDTGSNAIGAVAGLWLVLTLSTTGQAIALGLMAVATVYGEFRSISALIERTPLIRQLDSLGRLKARGEHA